MPLTLSDLAALKYIYYAVSHNCSHSLNLYVYSHDSHADHVSMARSNTSFSQLTVIRSPLVIELKSDIRAWEA
jgi:hypothetical protein